jgi:hypothetical protein
LQEGNKLSALIFLTITKDFPEEALKAESLRLDSLPSGRDDCSDVVVGDTVPYPSRAQIYMLPRNTCGDVIQ